MFRLVIIAIALLDTININCLPGDDVVVPQTRIFEDKITEAIKTELRKVPETHTIDSYDFQVPSPWNGQGTVKKFKLYGLSNWKVSDVYGKKESHKLNFGAKIAFRLIHGIGEYTIKLGDRKSRGKIRSEFSGLTFVIKGTVDLKKEISVTAEVTLYYAGIQVSDNQNPATTEGISICLQKNFANYVNHHKSKISKAVNAIIEDLIEKKHSSFTILADKLANQLKH